MGSVEKIERKRIKNTIDFRNGFVWWLCKNFSEMLCFISK